MSKQVKINGVWPLTLPDSSADEWIGNMKHHHNTWEMPRLLALEKLIKGHKAGRPVVIYIGAYKGDMAALLASWAADLVIMESTPAFWTLIEETWKLNPELPQPIGFFSGLLGREPNEPFTKDFLTTWPTRTAEYIEGRVGFTHLAESHDDPTFPRITIDEFVHVTGIVPDIITMDVEGSELEIMYGAIDTIENYSPALMLSVHPEFMFHNHGTYERELHDLVRDRGYVGEWIDYDHEHHWLYIKATK